MMRHSRIFREWNLRLKSVGKVPSDVALLNAIEPLRGHETSFNFGTGDGCESFQVKGYGFIGLGLEE